MPTANGPSWAVRPDPRDSERGLARRFARVAALADVHGNAPALEAVLAEPWEFLRTPPSREEAIEHAEMRAFSG